MSKGTLRCCGSPLYLKSKYGSGYSLVITRKKRTNSKVEATNYQHTDPNQDGDDVTQMQKIQINVFVN